MKTQNSILGRQLVKRFALCYRTVVSPVCLSVCDVAALWPNGWIDQDETWHGGRPRHQPHCLRWGLSYPLPPPKKKGGGTAAFPTFRPMYCSQTAGWIVMPLGTDVDLGSGYIVLDGDPDSPKRDIAAPSFRPMSIVAKRSPTSATAEHLRKTSYHNLRRTTGNYDVNQIWQSFRSKTACEYYTNFTGQCSVLHFQSTHWILSASLSPPITEDLRG